MERNHNKRHKVRRSEKTKNESRLRIRKTVGKTN